MLVCELGHTPEELDRMDAGLIQRMLIYKGVKNVAMFGGDWRP